MRMFNVRESDLMEFKELCKRAPAKIRATMLNMVNGFAIGTRKASLKIIESKMVVRNARFVQGRVQVQRATTARPSAEVGSVRAPRFDGWAEQELGKDTDRTRVFALMARGGNYHKQARPQARLKPGANFIKPEDYDGKTNRFRTMAMLADIRRKKLRRPFIIKKHNKFKSGLYKLVGGKIEQLQQFKTTKQPRRVKWMSGGVKDYFRTHSMRDQWAKAVNYILKRK